jgi:hypothetical protein
MTMENFGSSSRSWVTTERDNTSVLTSVAAAIVAERRPPSSSAISPK